MASFGLLDWDLTRWQQPTVFNLELMKLGSYYKQKRHLVKMLHNYNDELYSKVIVRKDYEDDDYPPKVFNNPKTEAGGLVFSGGLYSPLPEEIEVIPADTTIYTPMYRYYQPSPYYNSLVTGVHCRLSLDNKTIWKNWEKQVDLPKGHYIAKSFIIHDINVTSLNYAKETLSELEERFGVVKAYFGFRFPLKIKNDQELLDWSDFNILRNFSSIYLESFISDVTFNSLAKIADSYQYTMTPEMMVNERLVALFKQGVFLRSHNSVLLLNIEEPHSYSEYEVLLIELMNDYFKFKAHNPRYNYAPLYIVAKWWSNYLKYDLYYLFEYVRENNYELFKLFYECIDVELVNGTFREKFRR